MAPSSKLSPGCRRPAGGSQVPAGRWSRSMRPSFRTGRMPETRSAFTPPPQPRRRFFPPPGKYMIRRCGSRTAPSGLRPLRVVADLPRQPGENVQAFGEMEDRLRVWQLQAYLLHHRERLYVGLGWLERPQPVVYLAATDDAFLVGAVQAIPLGQEVLDGRWSALERFPDRAVTCFELRVRSAPVRADAPVVDLAVRDAAGHLGVEVRQVEGGAGEADGEAVVGVQGEKPDARPVPGRDVGAEVDLRKVREPGDGGQEMGPYARHVEGHDADPGPAFEGVDAESGRHERPEILRLDGPVHEEQVPPAHPHDPAFGRHGI